VSGIELVRRQGHERHTHGRPVPWWLREGAGAPEWLCGTCHPPVRDDVEVEFLGQAAVLKADLTVELCPDELQEEV
jgi:hypothetical protein